MIEPVFVANAVPKDTIFYLGVLGVETAALDWLVGLVYNRLARLPAYHPETMAEDTRKKVQKAIKLTDDAEVLEALHSVKGILADRNLFLHGIILSSTPDGAVDKTRAYRGVYQGEDQEHSEDRIKKLIDRIGQTNGALFLHSGLKH